MPAGLAVAVNVQVLPFQCSPHDVFGAFVDDASTPTATQFVELEHETLTSAARGTPVGLTPAATVQRVPSQCSTNARTPGEREPFSASAEPTAVQSVALVHHTPFSCVAWAPLGIGLGTNDHW